MIAYIKILERGAQIQPPCDECKRSKTDCIKVKKCCRECNGKHYKCSWNNITAQELQDNLLVLQLVREKEMESGSEGLKEETISTSYAPQQKDQDSAKPTMEQPTINQVFPHQEAASRKAYHSSEPSEVHVNHVDPTVAPCKRYKDEDQDEGSSRKDDTTSLGDVSPRQPQILDAETPRKKLKLFQAGYYRPSATGHSDNHSSSSGNLDGAPGKPGIGIAGSNRGQHEPDTDMETPRS